MALLLYKSNEMFSSTELIRKSKMIFDRILGKKIEKAIILRDGKPSFLLMEFSKYEKIMSEYEELKEYVESLEEGGQIKPKKLKKKQKLEDQKLKKELEIEAKALSMDGGDYSDIKKQIDAKEIEKIEETTEEEIQELEEETNEVEVEEVVSKPSENETKPMVQELSEDEEIEKAYASIESMNFDEEMKEQAKQKIRLKILQARQERIALAKEQEQKMQEEKELEQKVQKEKLKKEQELEEFWD